jgi:hypothetical protein
MTTAGVPVVTMELVNTPSMRKELIRQMIPVICTVGLNSLTMKMEEFSVENDLKRVQKLFDMGKMSKAFVVGSMQRPTWTKRRDSSPVSIVTRIP